MSLRESIWRVVPYAIEDVPLTSQRNELAENFFSVLRDDLKAQVGFTVVLVFILVAIFAPVLAPYDPMAQKFPIL
jgi:ABC-type antimicrobial peptide transport system permease subunit